MNTTSGPGLEGVLARISAEVTEARCRATVAGATDGDAAHPVALQRRARQKPEKPLLSAGHLRDAAFRVACWGRINARLGHR